MIRKIGFTLLVIVAIAIMAFLVFVPRFVDAGRNSVEPHKPYEISAAAQSLHDDLIIGDWHTDSLLWRRDLLDRHDYGHADLPRLIDGNVTLQFFTAVTKSPKGQNYGSNSADAPDNITPLVIAQLWPPRTWGSLFERAHYQAERLHKFAKKSDGQLVVITNLAELDDVLARKAAGDKVVGGLLGMEGAHPLEGDIDNLDRLYAAGYRLVGLQHFFDNALGGSLHGVGSQGLTEFGREVVERAQSKHMIIDVAHSSPAVVEDVLEMTQAPIVLSHTGLHSHCQSRRNISDDLMRGIANTGGVIGIGYWADVTCDDTPSGVAKTIIAAMDAIGVDHVSLGSDFDGAVHTGIDTSELAAITDALLDLGVSKSDIHKIMGGNMIRILRAQLPKDG